MRVSSARTFYRPFRGAARGGHIGLLVAALALFSRPPATAGETMGRLAHDDRLVVRGLTEIEPERLAAALVADDELLLLSRPLAQRKGFLTAVGEKATLALAHAGFASARATARVEADGDSEHVVVDVVEGPRHAAAAIRIDGLPPDLSERLHRWLLSHRPPPGAMPQAQDVGGEWSGTRWVDSRGLPARLEEAVWSPGQPAPFDPPFLRTVRTAVARFLRDEGYYAAARIVESPGSSRVPDSDAPTSDEQQPAASCDVAVRADAEGATLVIAFENLPPPATLRTIDVLPGARTTAADLERTLGIGVGERVTERDRLVWRERLRQSGRFVRHEVTLRELPGGRGTHAGNPGADVVATFDLEEYPPVPSLAEPLSREETAMLAFRSWLLETLANDHDLVVACMPTADAAGAAASPPAWECVVSTREGAFFGALPGTDTACGVAVSADGLGCFLPSQAGSFTVPLRGRRRVTLDVSFSLKRGSAAGPTPFERQLQAGCGIEPRPRDAVAALAVTARIEPVACLSLVHEGDPTIVWEGDDLVVSAAGSTARFDSRTGRLESVDVAACGHVAIDAAEGRFSSGLAALREAAGADRARPDALVSSAVDFLTDDATTTAAKRISAAMGLEEQRLILWQEIVTDVADRLRRIANAGGFAAADHLAGAVLDSDEIVPPLVIPRKGTAPPDADPLAQLTRLATARAWRWIDRCCGRDSWPTSLARVAAFAAARDISALWELTAYMGSTRHGPLALLVAASTAPTEALAAGLARQGQTRLSAEAFRADCEPLVAILRNAGLDLPLVMLLRSVDDEEARRLGRSLAGDERLLLPIVRDLRSRASDEAALGALPEATESWWRESLGAVIAKALADRSQLKTAGKPAPAAAPAR